VNTTTIQKWNLREYNDYSKEDSNVEAKRRVESKIQALQPIWPGQLALDLCSFIGFWLGDGSVQSAKSGGRRFSAAQGLCYPHIIEWFESVMDRAKIHRTKTLYEAHVSWNFSRGTGGGNQKRHGGVSKIEPYLQKQHFRWMWGLEEQQIDCLIHGFWMADGNHCDGISKPESHGMRIYNTNRALLETLQAVATVRGYRTSVKWKNNGPKAKKDIGCLSLRKQLEYSIGNDRLEVEPEWKDERVWCVTVSSGAIITRRNGKVAVLGNCTGWDFPGLKTIVMAQPTKSLPHYTQIFGRVTRPIECDGRPVVDFNGSTPETRKKSIENSDKPHGRVIDLVDNSLRHKLATALDVLGGKWSLVQREQMMQSMIVKGGDFTVEELGDEQKKREAEERRLEEERKQERLRRQRASREATATFHDQDVNPFGGNQARRKLREQRIMATTKQCKYLWVLGFKDVDQYLISKAQAGRIITHLKGGANMSHVHRTNRLQKK